MPGLVVLFPYSPPDSPIPPFPTLILWDPIGIVKLLLNETSPPPPPDPRIPPPPPPPTINISACVIVSDTINVCSVCHVNPGLSDV